MRAIRAGLDIRNLNNENINFSTITDRVQAGKLCYQCSSGRDIKSRPRNKNQPWYPEMSKFFTKRSSLSYSLATSLILSDCERLRCWLHSMSGWQRKRFDGFQQKQPVASYSTAGSALISSQVVSASKFRNCIFDIKCCSNWTRDKERERQSSGCFVDGSLHFLRNAILYTFSLSVIFSLFSRGS